jgi:hypothetical protein
MLGKEESNGLRLLGGCHALQGGKECHAEARDHGENLCEKTRK